jgi:hypothetical protein
MACLHDYEAIRDDFEISVEVCKRCHKQIFMRKDRRGRVDNDIYRIEHARDLLQPVGATANLYQREYGK